jgi:ABC-type transport system involved in multi-copper enzyme maturation permease subunit
MTAPTLAPHPSATAGHDRFAHLLRAEWIKFRTVRGWVIATVAAMLLTLLLGLFTAVNSQEGCPGGPCHFVIPTGPGGEAVTDAFYFVHRPLTADGSITVRVTSLTGVIETGLTPQGPARTVPGLQPWSKAGLIVSAGSRQGSAYTAVMVTGGHGARMQWNYTGDTASPGKGAGEVGRVSAASPRWLRLTRAGDTLTGYDSASGTRWTRIGTVSLPGLTPTVQAGLFVTSPAYSRQVSQQISGGSGTGDPTDATATFDRVSLRGGWPGRGWRGASVNGGSSSTYTIGSGAGYRQADGAFTVTGSGDIAPGAPGGASISGSLAGAFIGLIAVVVLGALFITAEYRRGLIRLTLAASPRRGRVLAAKAVVLCAVTFAAGLVGAAVAVGLGGPLTRASGSPIYPVSAFTEVRVIAGSAALFAVAAVFALGVGAIVRHGAGAVTVVITAIILPYLLAAAFPVLPTGAADWLLRVTPAAGFAIQQAIPAYPQVAASYTPFNGYFPLAPWAGFAVLCAYAAVALALATFLLRRRDA